MPNWAAGRDAAMDVTVVNPMQAATLVQAATTQGHALSLARGAAEDCRRQGITFLPLAVESFGGWHSAVLGRVLYYFQKLSFLW